MNAMNLQERKLSFIQEVLNITDERFFARLEKFLKTEKKNTPKQELTPMSPEEFYAMIDQSLQDSKEGKFISTEELKRKVRQWR